MLPGDRRKRRSITAARADVAASLALPSHRREAAINAIAAQANLLALNATIEVARATQHVADQAGSIQQESTAAIASIEQVTTVISEVSAMQHTIASAVEEQTVASATGSTKTRVTRAVEAAHELAAMSDRLHQVVATYRH